jgi:hypothetical protein
MCVPCTIQPFSFAMSFAQNTGSFQTGVNRSATGLAARDIYSMRHSVGLGVSRARELWAGVRASLAGVRAHGSTVAIADWQSVRRFAYLYIMLEVPHSIELIVAQLPVAVCPLGSRPCDTAIFFAVPGGAPGLQAVSPEPLLRTKELLHVVFIPPHRRR